MSSASSPDLTPAELTLLGLLVEQPRHGYELEAVIAGRGMRAWTEIGFSSIYYLLKKLQRRGLIAPADPAGPGGGTSRAVYEATGEGRRACAEAAEAAIAEVRPVFPPLLVGLANQPAVAHDRLLAALDRRSRALAERVAHVRRAAEADRDAPPFVRAIFDHALGQLTAEQDWLTRYRASLETAPTPGSERPMAPYDVKREQRALYAPRNTGWDLVEVPAQRFLAVDGTGDPNTAPAYAHAVEALYGVAYTLKFAAKRAGDRDFVVGPLEGLWWADRWDAFTARAKDTWNWTMLISLPPWIGEEPVEEAKAAALARKKRPTIARVRVLALDEGLCAQVLHTGSYDDETPVLADLHERYLPANGLRPTGKHHEIYLGDPRRTAPEKLRTVLRQPVERLPEP